MSFTDDLPVPQTQKVPLKKAPPPRQLTVAERRQEMLRETEEQVAREALEIVAGVLGMLEVDPDDTDEDGNVLVPQVWADKVALGEMTQAEADKKLRAALYALMPGKDAPVGLKIALDTYAGILKARALEKGGPKTLQMVMVEMTAPAPVFDILEVDE